MIRSSQHRPCNLLVLTAILVAWLSISGLRAQEIEGQEKIYIRDVFIPSEKIEEYVKGYIAADRHQLEGLLDESLHRGKDETFVSAEVEAELIGDGLVNGRGSFQRNSSPMFSSRAEGEYTLLPFLSNLIIERPRWQHDDTSRAAVIGGFGTSTILLLEPNMTELNFEWSLTGQRRSGTLRFQIELPPALSHRVRLHIPNRQRLRTRHGVVTRDPGPQATTWTIELGGLRTLDVIIEDIDTPKEAFSASVRQQCSYEVTVRGLDMMSQLTLMGPDIPAALELRVAPGLKVTRVETEGKPIIWSQSVGVQGTPIRVELPDKLKADHLDITVFAVGGMPIDQRFSLPRLRLLNTSWAGETITLQIRNPLKLNDVRLEDCFCSKVQSDRPAGEEYVFDMGSPAANLSLFVQKLDAVVDTETVFLTELSAQRITSRTFIRVHPREGELFEILARVPTGWIVDHADAISETALPDVINSIKDRWSHDEESHEFHLRLKQAASSSNPVLVEVGLHADRKDAANLNESIANLIAMQEVLPDHSKHPTASRVMVLRAAADFELSTLRTSEGNWRHESELASWFLERSPLRSTDLILQLDSPSAEVGVQLQESKKPLEFTPHTDVTINENTVQVSTALEVHPIADQQEFEVTFNKPLPATTTWSVNGNQDRIDVRKQVPENLGTPDRESYTIRLPMVANDAPRVDVKFEIVTTGEIDVPLPLSEEATNIGTVAVHGVGGISTRIIAQVGLQAIPIIATQDTPDLRDLRAVFRYDNTSSGLLELVVARVDESVHHPYWVWRSDVRSYYTKSGSTRHRADLFVQNEGARNLKLKLPEKFTLDFVAINGERVPSGASGGESLSVTIPLPETDRFPCVSVYYVEAPRTLAPIDWLPPPFPKLDVRTIQETWHIWLPPAFQIYTAGNQSDDWLGRVFGTLPQRENTQGGLQYAVSSAKRALGGIDDVGYLIRQFTRMMGSSQIVVGPELRDRDLAPMLSADTWAGRLARIETSLRQIRPDFQLTIDRTELRRLGLFADASLPTTRESDYRQIGIDRLKQVGVGLLVSPDKIVVTSASELNSYNIPSWIDQIALPYEPDWLDSPRAISARDWGLDMTQQLWRPTTDDLEIHLREAGWISYRTSVSDNHRSLKIYRRETIVALYSAAFFFSAALGWYWVRNKRQRWCALLAGSAVAALVLPQPGATIAIAVAWGAVVSAVLHVAKQSTAKSYPTASSVTTATHVAQLLVVVIFLSTCPNVVFAQENPAIPTINLPNGAPVYPVLIPSEHERPKGNVVYIPAELAKRFHERPTSSEHSGYLFTSCRYSGDWPRLEDKTDARISTSIRLTTLKANASIELPDFGPQAAIDIASVRLDRRSVNVVQGQNRGTILVPQPGDYTLSIDLRTRVERRFGFQYLRFQIPRVASSTLALELPTDVQSARVPSALGRTTVDLQRGSLEAKLGPTQEVFVETNQLEIDPDNLGGIEQLVLVELTQDAVNIENRFRFAGRSMPLRMRVDSRLRLMPMDNVTLVDGSKRDDRTYEVILAPTTPDGLPSIRFEYEYQGTELLTLPDMGVLDFPVRQRWVAITPDPTSSVDLKVDGASVAVPADFLGDWELAPATTDEITSTATEAPLTFRVRHLPAQTSWDSTTSFSFSKTSTGFLMNSVVDLGPEATATIQRLQVPPQMLVQNVTATAGNIPTPLRWSHNDDGVLMIVFLDPPRLQVQLQIGGILAASNADDVTLSLIAPILSDPNDSQSSHRVLLYKKSGRAVTMVSNRGFEDDSEGEVPLRPGFRFVSGWRSSAPNVNESPLILSAAQKQTTTRAKLVTKLSRTEEWSTSFKIDLTTEAGHIEDFGIEIPATLQQPKLQYYVDGDEITNIVEPSVLSAPRSDRRIIQIRSPAIVKSCTVELHMQIAPSPDGVSLPYIRLLDVEQVSHEIWLPDSSFQENGRSTYTWSLVGLSPLVDPGNDFPNDDYTVYSAAQEYSAELRRDVTADILPEIHFVETSIRWADHGGFVGLTTLDLQPASLTQCVLRLPRHCRLVQVMIDGYRTAAQQLKPDTELFPTWQIQLGAKPWPQQLLVLYQGTCQINNNGNVKFWAPRLMEDDEAIPYSSQCHEVWNLFAPHEAGHGYALNVDPELQLPNTIKKANDDAVKRLRGDAQFLVQDLGMTEVFSRVFERAENRNRQRPWDESQWFQGDSVRCMTKESSGALPSVVVKYPRFKREAAHIRYVLAAIIGWMAIVLPSWKGVWPMIHWMDRRAGVIVVGLGVAWIYFLAPRWVGVLIIVTQGVVWTIGKVRHGRLLLPTRGNNR